jgi:hypothetical protein
MHHGDGWPPGLMEDLGEFLGGIGFGASVGEHALVVAFGDMGLWRGGGFEERRVGDGLT